MLTPNGVRVHHERHERALKMISAKRISGWGEAFALKKKITTFPPTNVL